MNAQQIAEAWSRLTAEQTTYQVELTIELLRPDGQPVYQQKHTTKVVTGKDDLLAAEIGREIREQVTGGDPDLEEDLNGDGTETTWSYDALWIENTPTWRITAIAEEEEED